MRKLRWISHFLYAVTATSFGISANAQTVAFPSKPVRLITPYAPGGSASVIARTFADGLAKELGQSFIVENRPGSSSIIGTNAVAQSSPDGHTLLSISNTITVIHWTIPSRPYDTLRDLTGIATLVRNDHMVAAHPSLPANNLRELITYLKANPGKVNAYTSGLGSNNHLENLMFMQATETKYTIVPYKGGGSAMADLLAGNIQLAFNTPNLYAPLIKAGKLKGIAISGNHRNAGIPEVPTFSEGGLKDFMAGTWYVLMAPAATPREVVEKLNVSVNKLQASKEVQDLLTKQSIDPFPSSVAATNALLRAELDAAGKIVKEYNIKPEAD